MTTTATATTTANNDDNGGRRRTYLDAQIETTTEFICVLINNK